MFYMQRAVLVPTARIKGQKTVGLSVANHFLWRYLELIIVIIPLKSSY